MVIEDANRARGLHPLGAETDGVLAGLGLNICVTPISVWPIMTMSKREAGARHHVRAALKHGGKHALVLDDLRVREDEPHVGRHEDGVRPVDAALCDTP